MRVMKIRIGISACLLGDKVRYDGGHKHDPYLTRTLGAFFEYHPVCPEVELGLGVPRESVRLVSSGEGVRMQGVRSGKDFTNGMAEFTRKRVEALAGASLHGYVLKKDSPSCGMDRVRVYHASGSGAERQGRGLFAQGLLQRLPLLPVEEEGRLHDPVIRENFVERVFCYYRWMMLRSAPLRAKHLIEFHAKHKLTLLSHSRKHYEELGRLVAGGFDPKLPDLYGATFMECLKVKATPGKHTNVLTHLAGYLKKSITADDKTELVSCIDDYRKGLVPLIVPITLLKHHLKKHPVPWAMQQTYLNPYPGELMLRNHV